MLVLVLLAAVTCQRRGEDPPDDRASTDICDGQDTDGTQGGDPRAAGVAFRPATASASPASVEPTPALADTDLGLLWADEFDGGEVDLSTWSTRECWHDRPGFVNDSDAWIPYPARSTNLDQRDGVVRLKAVKDKAATDHGKVMTSAMLTTRERFDSFTHGVVEARFKVPTGRGLWPAFWLMGNGTDTNGWPETGEIDIFEFVNNGTGGTGRMYSSVHWGEIAHGVTTHDAASKSYAVPWWGDDEFHTFTLHRTSEFLRFFIDGAQVMELVPGELVPGYPAAVPVGGPLFEDPMHVRLSLEVGGSWAGQGYDTSMYEPGELVVDYVRAWG